MPRDRRLYMTFPIDFHRHPKFKNLSVEAKWTFVEMNGEARLAENDGRFEYEEAVFLWHPDVLEELAGSHPTRPLIVRDGDFYVIRDYAEHQFTKADRDELRAKRVKAGQASAAKRSASVEHVLNKPEHPATESESESESGIDGLNHVLESQSLNTRANVATDPIPISTTTKRLAGQKGINNLRTVVDAIHRKTGVTVTADQAFQLCVLLLERAKEWPDNPQPYVLSCISKNPHEITQHLYERIGVS